MARSTLKELTPQEAAAAVAAGPGEYSFQLPSKTDLGKVRMRIASAAQEAGKGYTTRQDKDHDRLVVVITDEPQHGRVVLDKAKDKPVAGTTAPAQRQHVSNGHAFVLIDRGQIVEHNHDVLVINLDDDASFEELHQAFASLMDIGALSAAAKVHERIGDKINAAVREELATV